MIGTLAIWEITKLTFYFDGIKTRNFKVWSILQDFLFHGNYFEKKNPSTTPTDRCSYSVILEKLKACPKKPILVTSAGVNKNLATSNEKNFSIATCPAIHWSCVPNFKAIRKIASPQDEFKVCVLQKCHCLLYIVSVAESSS